MLVLDFIWVWTLCWRTSEVSKKVIVRAIEKVVVWTDHKAGTRTIKAWQFALSHDGDGASTMESWPNSLRVGVLQSKVIDSGADRRSGFSDGSW